MLRVEKKFLVGRNAIRRKTPKQDPVETARLLQRQDAVEKKEAEIRSDSDKSSSFYSCNSDVFEEYKKPSEEEELNDLKINYELPSDYAERRRWINRVKAARRGKWVYLYTFFALDYCHFSWIFVFLPRITYF